MSEALPPRGISLIEASAGTGKTYRIATICARLVAEERVPLSQILVATFSNAATSELRDRVRNRLRVARDAFASALAGVTDAAPPEVADLLASAREANAVALWYERLRTAAESFDDDSISTIHGFCARVVREHAFACGVDAGAELCATPPDLLEEIVRDFWDSVVATRPVAALRMLQDESKCTLDALMDVARKATRDADAPIEPAAPNGSLPSLADVCAVHDALRDAYATQWMAEHPSLIDEIRDARTEKRLKAASWRENNIPGRLEKMARWASDPELSLPKPFVDYFTPGPLSCDDGTPAVWHPLRDAAGALLEAQARRTESAAAESVAIKRACAEFARRELADRLRASRRLTYDDLLRSVRDALRAESCGGPLTDALRAAYSVALLDEFQDTDPVQWEIFHTLFETPSHRLVLIGDPKQAIYGFRGGDIYTYLKAREAASATDSLATNWRSDGAYLDAVNHLFGRHPSPFGGADIDYAHVGSTRPQRLIGGGAPFQLRVARSGEQHLPLAKNKTIPSKDAFLDRIPRLVAADIVRFLESGARIEEGEGVSRAVRPSDVAVLVRSNRQAAAVQQALREARVPCVLHSAESVFASRDAAELELVLHAVLEPTNAARVRAALATDLIGRAAGIELGAQPCGPGDVVARLVHEEGDALLDTWHERFRLWRDRWLGRGRQRGAGVAALVRTIVGELALPARLLAFDDGERRLSNLLHLAELLHGEETASGLDPRRVVVWLRAQIDADLTDDTSRQLRLETDADAAQIVTMHGSKGLEYPAVWCPYLWDGMLAQGADKKHPYFRAHDDQGNLVRKLHLAPDLDPEVLDGLDDEAFAENLRLAYVALTRARHRCTVWWARVSGGESSPLGWLLHGESALDAREARTSAATFESLTDDDVRARVDEIASGNASIAVLDEMFAAPTTWRGAAESTAPVVARAFERAEPLADGWRVGSFTGLTHGASARIAAEHDLPESIDDARSETAEDVELATDRVPLADFPASADAGICVHAIFEQHDFGNAATLGPLVGDRLRAFGFDAPRWTDTMSDMVTRVLDASIGTNGDALRLRDVARERRMTELRFELPACGGYDASSTRTLTAHALADAFERHAGGALPDASLASYASSLRALGFAPLHGFLTGAIDLLVEHGGRWWVVDWKSNKLGEHASDYAGDRLLDEMTSSHYVLQYHLYLVAVHRWLRARVRDYDYDTHIGGACYPFVRGVAADAKDASLGLFVDRPPKARVEALDALLQEGA